MAVNVTRGICRTYCIVNVRHVRNAEDKCCVFSVVFFVSDLPHWLAIMLFAIAEAALKFDITCG